MSHFSDRQGSPLIQLIILSTLVVSSCGRPTTTPPPEVPASGPGTSSPPTSPSPTPTVRPEMLTVYTLEDGETEIPVPLPMSWAELLEKNVDDGTWEYDDGLVFLLSYVAGELEADSILGFHEVQEGSPTSLVRLAKDYLQSTDRKPGPAADVERLLGRLTPTQAVLDRISQPSGMAGGGGTYLASHRPQADVPEECANIVEDGFSASVDTGQFCYVFREVSEQQNRLRVYYPKWWEDNPEQMPWVEAAVTGLFDSSPVYSDLGRFDNVNVVFAASQGQGNATARAYQSYFPLGEACPVVALPLIYGESVEAFQQSIAHESFHCFQDWNFVTAPYGTHEWWLEGSATYFSNAVYPAINAEYRYFDDAVRSSILSPIFDLAYENFLLFQHLANQLGDAGLVSLLDSVSRSGGIGGQSATLAGYPNFDSMFQQYAVEISSEGVRDSDGHRESLSPINGFEYGKFSQEREEQFRVDPFTIGRFIYAYEKERRFIEEPLLGDTALHSAVIGSERRDLGAWSSLPPEIRSGCGEDLKYMIVITSVDGLADFTANVTSVEEAECDSCVLGKWDVDGVSFARYYEALFASGGQPTGLFVAGHFYLEFMEDEGFATRRHGLQISTSIADQPSLVTTIDGQGSGKYGADGESLTISGFSSRTNNVAIRIEGVELPPQQGGGTVSYGLFDDAPRQGGDDSTPNYRGSYTCDLDDLVIQFPKYGDVTFHRVEDVIPTPVPTPAG
jgi:hypothetical protein